MKKKIGTGIIGCGNISEVYIPNLLGHYESVELLALANRTAEKAKRCAETYGVPRACSVDELLQMPDIDIVLNLTTPESHYEINKKILAAGKHLYSEKPLALTLADAQEITALAKEKGLMAVSAPDTILGAGAQTGRLLLDSGVIGKPVAFTANMTCPGHELWHPAPAFYYKKGAGPVFDMGPYYLTALVNLLGPIRRISCFATQGRPLRNICGVMTPSEVPTNYTAILEFSCGATGTMIMSFDPWDSALPCIEIYGTDGTMKVPDPNCFNGPVRIFNGRQLEKAVTDFNGQVPTGVNPKAYASFTCRDACGYEAAPEFPLPRDPAINMRGMGAEDMARALLSGRAPVLDPAVSLHIVEALNAFDRAAESGTVYEMKTHCSRPEKIPAGTQYWID